MVTTTRGRATTPADLDRLARKADLEGLLPVRLSSSTPERPRYACESGTDAMTVYHIDLIEGCDCFGYAGGEHPDTGQHVDGYGRCKHHSKALELEGWLPDLPDTEHDRIIAAAAKRRSCGWCHGEGLVHDPDGKGAPELCPKGCPIPTPEQLRERRERLAAQRERLEAAGEAAIGRALAQQSGHPAGAPGLRNARAACQARSERQRKRDEAALARGEALARRATHGYAMDEDGLPAGHDPDLADQLDAAAGSGEGWVPATDELAKERRALARMVIACEEQRGRYLALAS